MFYVRCPRPPRDKRNDGFLAILGSLQAQIAPNSRFLPRQAISAISPSFYITISFLSIISDRPECR